MKGGDGMIAWILGAIGVAIIGTVTSYFGAYIVILSINQLSGVDTIALFFLGAIEIIVSWGFFAISALCVNQIFENKKGGE